MTSVYRAVMQTRTVVIALILIAIMFAIFVAGAVSD